MDARDRLFGEIAVQLQFLNREQVAECILAQQGEHSGRLIGEIAVALGFMSRDDSDTVAERQEKVLEKRRATIKRVPQVEEVVQPRLPKRDLRADTVTPQRRQAPASKPTIPMVDLALPRSPNPPMELADTRPGTDPDDPASKVAMALADTRPGAGEDQTPTAQGAGSASPDDYDFGAPPVARGGTIVGTGVKKQARGVASTGDTIEQPSGAAARRAPADRAWRNPSSPPDDVGRAETDPFLLDLDAPPPRKGGTLVGNAGANKPAVKAPAAAPVSSPIAAPAAKPAPSVNDSHFLDRLLGLSVESGATDLHAHSDAPLLARVDGLLLPLSGDAPLARSAAERVIAEIMTEAQWHTLAAHGHARFTYEIPMVGRFRAHVYRDERGLGAVFRILPRLAKSMEDLGLPQRLYKLLDPPRGLVLCAGPRGSGKTSTCAALVSALADGRGVHAVSLEEPVELAFRVQRGAITRVEVPAHVPSFAVGVEQALALGAQVIALSELSSSESVLSALSAAEAGACVLACVAAAHAAQAIEKVLRTVEPNERTRAREALAETLRVVTNQRLLVQAVGHGHVPALEIVPGGAQLAGLIREDKLGQLAQLMASGKGAGMVSLDDSLDELLQNGIIAPSEARRFASKKERFKS